MDSSDFQDPQDPAVQAAQLRQQQADSRAAAEDLTQLLRSAGWERVRTMLEQSHNAAFQAALKATEPLQVGQLLGVCKALRDLATWPERELAANKSILSTE